MISIIWQVFHGFGAPISNGFGGAPFSLAAAQIWQEILGSHPSAVFFLIIDTLDLARSQIDLADLKSIWQN